uniref:Uncharacterized protein n=1 Tax=Anguilla anguilla TaxID=7936 RepID=A0A0E9VVT5_ANGAN
MPFIQVSN